MKTIGQPISRGAGAPRAGALLRGLPGRRTGAGVVGERYLEGPVGLGAPNGVARGCGEGGWARGI